MEQEISANDFKKIIKEHKNVILLDVRSRQEYKEGHLNGSISIPSYDILKNVNNIIENKNAVIVVYCQHGTRSKKVAETLKKLGYTKVYTLKNGMEELKKN